MSKCEKCGTELRREVPPLERGDELHSAARCRDILQARVAARDKAIEALRRGIMNALDNLRLDDAYPGTSRAAAIFQLDEALTLALGTHSGSGG